jgi:TATA element modulatory factor
VQRQVEDLKKEIRKLEDEILLTQSKLQLSQEQIQLLQSRLTSQQDAFIKEKRSLQETFDNTFENRLREEKQKWEEDQLHLFSPPPLSATLPHFASSPISPRLPNRGFKSVSPQPEPFTKPRIPSRTTSYGELPQIRRPSRMFSTTSFEQSAPHISTLEDEEEREFLSPSRGDSPKNTVVDAVSVSASTGTAGPSVNIIERMSSAVRRLESDLSATKEEMARVLRQRDEAREECVRLMGEVEEKRKFETALKDFQGRFDELDNRYATHDKYLMQV